jgi:hypothetical protein
MNQKLFNALCLLGVALAALLAIQGWNTYGR